MKTNLNLCTDSWLPVRLRTGSCVRLSLESFFASSHEVSDLVLATHERISVMRLLICIAQRAINGPADREEWEECKEKISPKSVDYLRKWRNAFNLLGENGAFLQPTGVCARELKDWGRLSKISMTSAEGNTPSLFDNSAGNERSSSLAQVAIDLLTFQNFAPGGTIGVTIWSGVQTGVKAPDSAPAAPCVPSSAIHLFVWGENMLDTIWYNLCTNDEVSHYRKGMGVPIWENMPTSMEHEEAIQNATTTYLGRLVPLSRVVKISTNADRCLVSKGIHYPVYSSDKNLLYYESSMSVVRTKDNMLRIVGADIDRAMWRNLPALLHRFSPEVKSFACLEEQDLPEHYGIWVGAMVLDQAKILGTMEDYYEHLDREYVGMAADKRQAMLMGMADNGIKCVKAALLSYYTHLNNPFENKKEVFSCAEKYFWSWLTLHKSAYINCLGTADEACESYITGIGMWNKIIGGAARRAFDLLASRNSVRQLSAWARARRLLTTNTKKGNGN